MSLEQVETGSFAPQEGMSHEPRTIQVVSWNIARGCRLDEIAEFLVGVNADLILLQEVDKQARRTAYRNIAEFLAHKLKLFYAFAIEFHELAQGSRDAPAYHGQVTLSRWPLCDSRVLRFSRHSTYWYPRRWIPSPPQFQRRLGGRPALLSHAIFGEKRLSIYNLHLESRERDEPGNAYLTHEKGFKNPFADLGLRTAQAHSFGRSNTIELDLDLGTNCRGFSEDRSFRFGIRPLSSIPHS
jgi:hypothetical protein